MTTNIKKINTTWSEFDSDIAIFSNFIKQFNFDKNSVILSIKRGGFTTSSTLSNKLSIPLSVVSYQTRDGAQTLPKFLESEMLTFDKKIIIPDDIYDSGKTIETIVEYLTIVYQIPIENIMGLFHYNSDEIQNTKLKCYHSCHKSNGNWIEYPWE